MEGEDHIVAWAEEAGGARQALKRLAEEVLGLRVRSSTRKNYATAWRHWEAFCRVVGREQGGELTREDVHMFCAYLYAQNILPENTVGPWAGAWREKTGVRVGRTLPGIFTDVRLMHAKLKEWRFAEMGWDTRIKAVPFRPVILRAWIEGRMGMSWNERDVSRGAVAMLVCVLMARAGAVGEARVGDVQRTHFYEFKPKTGKKGEGRKHGWFGGDSWANPRVWLHAQQAWRRRRGAKDGDCLFVGDGGKALTTEEVGEILQQMVGELGEGEAKAWDVKDSRMTGHSGRRGGAMAAMDGGMEKLVLGAIGNWAGDDVYEYTVGQHLTFQPRSTNPHHILFRFGCPKADAWYPRTAKDQSLVLLEEDGAGGSYVECTVMKGEADHHRVVTTEL